MVDQSLDKEVFLTDSQLQEFLIHKMSVINNIPYQKDVTRFIDTS
jgi:hypothetical protein